MNICIRYILIIIKIWKYVYFNVKHMTEDTKSKKKKKRSENSRRKKKRKKKIIDFHVRDCHILRFSSWFHLILFWCYFQFLTTDFAAWLLIWLSLLLSFHTLLIYFYLWCVCCCFDTVLAATFPIYSTLILLLWIFCCYFLGPFSL